MNDYEPKILISSTKAALRFGITNDYVSLLCRQKKVEGTFVNRAWLVDPESLQNFLAQMQAKRAQQKTVLAQELKKEYQSKISAPAPVAQKVLPVEVSKQNKAISPAWKLDQPLVPVGGPIAFNRLAVSFAVVLVCMFGLSAAAAGANLGTQAAAAVVESPFFVKAHVADTLSHIFAYLFGPKDAEYAVVSEKQQGQMVWPAEPVAAPTGDPRTFAPAAFPELVSPLQNIINNYYTTTNPVVARAVASVDTQAYVPADSFVMILAEMNRSIHEDISRIVGGSLAHFRGGGGGGGGGSSSSVLTITDADVPDTITASNYLPLAGGTLTGQLLSSSTATTTLAAGIEIQSGCFKVNGTCLGGSAVTNLDSLTDVSVAAPVFGDILSYTGSGWGNVATSSLGLASLASFSASAPLSYNSATGQFSISQATASTNGYVSSTDWDSFNSRLSTSTLALIDKGFFFSTTSAEYWKLVNNFFSTTSADYWGLQKGYTNFGYLFPGNATSTLLTFSGGLAASGLTITGGSLAFSSAATTTVVNNNPYAWTIATSTGGSPLFRVDTTSGSESVSLGWKGGGDVIIGDVGIATNLVFEESSTIHGQGLNTLTFGQTGDKINFAVNTGFGTSTPWRTLSVNGNSDLGNNALAGYFTATSTTATSTFAGAFGIGTTTPWAQLSINPNGIVGPSFAIGSSTATSFVVTNAGRVGIGGPTNPTIAQVVIQMPANAAGLTVSSNGLTTTGYVSITNSGSDTPIVLLNRNGSASRSAFNTWATSNTNQWSLGVSGNTTGQINSLQFIDYSTDSNGVVRALFLQGSGNYGVGTSTPWGKISASSTSAYPALAIEQFSTGPAAVFLGGNVGIGTTSPYAKLSVVGDVVAARYVATTTATSTFAGAIQASCFSVDGSTCLSSGASFAYPFPSNATSTLLSFNGGLTAYASTTIGDGSITGGLTINGAATTTGGAYFASNVGISGPVNFAKLFVQGTDSPFNELFSGVTKAVRIGTDSTAAYIEGVDNTGLGSYQPLHIGGSMLTFYSQSFGGEVMRVDSTGNVGIGTTTPANKLSVQGNTLISGNLTVANLTATGTVAFNGGLTAYASSTIGDGTQAGGLTVSGGATTTGNSYFAGRVSVGSTTPWAQFSINPNGITGPSFAIGSSTATNFVVGNNGKIGIGTSNTTSSGNIVTVIDAAGTGIFLANTLGTNNTSYTNLTNSQNGGSIILNRGTGVSRFTSLTFLRNGASEFSLGNGTGGVDSVDFYMMNYQNGAVSNGTPSYYINSASNNLGVGSSTAPSRLTVWGAGSGTGNLFSLINAASTTVMQVFDNGNVGIGTTTPFATLQVATTTGKNIALSDSGAGADLKHWLLSSLGGSFYLGTTTDAYATSTIAALTINSSGNMGIGTTTPYAKLTVAGEAVAYNFTATSTNATSTFAGGLTVGNGAINYDFSSGVTSINNLAIGSFTFDTDAGIVTWADLPISSSATAGTVESYTASVGGSSLLTIYGEADGSGSPKNLRVGIGTTSPAYLLDVATTTAGVDVARFTNGTGSCTINPTNTALSCSSDERLKKNVATIGSERGEATSSTLARILQLDPVLYNWTREATSSEKHAGFIAQKVNLIFPDLVSQDGNGYYGVNYGGFAPYFAAAIQEIGRITGGFKDALVAWLGDMGNGITKIFAAEVQTDRLCVGSVCVTQDQFLAMAQASGVEDTTPPDSGPPPSATSTPPHDTPPVATSTPPMATSTPPVVTPPPTATSTPPAPAPEPTQETPPPASVETPPAAPVEPPPTEPPPAEPASPPTP